MFGNWETGFIICWPDSCKYLPTKSHRFLQSSYSREQKFEANKFLKIIRTDFLWLASCKRLFDFWNLNFYFRQTKIPQIFTLTSKENLNNFVYFSRLSTSLHHHPQIFLFKINNFLLHLLQILLVFRTSLSTSYKKTSSKSTETHKIPFLTKQSQKIFRTPRQRIRILKSWRRCLAFYEEMFILLFFC
jgi:hypothetical protein